jgi:hypothetical protein
VEAFGRLEAQNLVESVTAAALAAVDSNMQVGLDRGKLLLRLGSQLVADAPLDSCVEKLKLVAPRKQRSRHHLSMADRREVDWGR